MACISRSGSPQSGKLTPSPTYAYPPSLHSNSNLQLSFGLNDSYIHPSFFPHTPCRFGGITIPTPRWSSASACKLRSWCPLSTCWSHPILRQSTFCPRQHRPSFIYQSLELQLPIPSLLTTPKLLYSPVSADLSRSMNGTTPSPCPAPAPKTSPSPAAGTKRKRTGGAKYYAVKKGYKPGLYYSWNDCLAQVTGFKGAICESAGNSTPLRSSSPERSLPYNVRQSSHFPHMKMRRRS